jgi:hypothetical protein
MRYSPRSSGFVAPKTLMSVDRLSAVVDALAKVRHTSTFTFDMESRRANFALV